MVVVHFSRDKPGDGNPVSAKLCCIKYYKLWQFEIVESEHFSPEDVLPFPSILHQRITCKLPVYLKMNIVTVIGKIVR